MDAKWSLICEIMSTLRVLKRCVMKKIVINIYHVLQGECTELFMGVKHVHVQHEKYELSINLSNYTHVETASLNAGYFHLKLDSKCFCFM